jgi:hypothetical protein
VQNTPLSFCRIPSLHDRYLPEKLAIVLSVSLFCQIIPAFQSMVWAASLNDITFQSKSLTLKSDQPISAPRWNVWDSKLGKEKTKLFVIDLPGVKELSPEGAQSARAILKSNSAVKKLICRPSSPGVMRVYFEVSTDSIGQMAPVLKFKNKSEVNIQFQPIPQLAITPQPVAKQPTEKIKLSPNTAKTEPNPLAVSPKVSSPVTPLAPATKISNQPIYPAGSSLNTEAASTKGLSQGSTLTIKNDQGQFETVSMIGLIERQSKKITALEAQLKESNPAKPSSNELALQRRLTELSQDNDILKAQVQRLETELAIREQREKLASQPAFTPQTPPEPVSMLNLASPIVNSEPPAITPPEVGQAVQLVPSAAPSARPAIRQPGISGQSTTHASRERVVVIEQKAKTASSASPESNKMGQWLQSRKGKSPFAGLTLSPQKMLSGAGPSAQFTLKRKKDTDTPQALMQKDASPEVSFMSIMDPHPTDAPTIKALKASIKTQQDNPNAYYQIATAYKQQGELTKASDVLKTLVRSFPTQSKAYLELVDLNLATGKPLDAHVYLDEYKKLNGQDTLTITALQNRINLAMNSFIQTMEAQK